MKKVVVFLILTIFYGKLFSQTDKKITYYENGNKKELVHYYDGKLDGACIAWNDSNIIIGKVHYKNGLKDGKWFIWHSDGTPAYKFYYRKNEKVGIWKFYDEFGKLLGVKEYLPTYGKNTLITLGTFTMSDISIGITQRLNRNKLFAVGGEYSTYIADGEYGDFTDFEKFSKHCILGTAGLIGNEWAILLKAGTSIGDNVKFDYGGEFLLSFDGSEKIMPLFGFSFTKEMKAQLKFGIFF